MRRTAPVRSVAYVVLVGALGSLVAGALTVSSATADTTEPPETPAGLVGRWHLDTVAGGTTPDSSGGNHPGSVVSMSSVPGLWGNAVRDNDNGGNVRIPGPLTGTTAITVLAWVHRNEDSPGTYEYVVEQGAFSCTAATWGLYTGASGGLEFYMYDGNAAYRSSNAGPGMWTNAWHAVAGVYDGQSVSLYVDGQLVGSPQPAGAAMAFSQDRDIRIGDFANSCPVGGGIDATVDEVHVYDRALSAAEVVALQTGAPPPTPSPSSSPSTSPTLSPSPSPSPPGESSTNASFSVNGHGSSMQLVLNASASTGATKYRWDLNDDGIDDVECGQGNPVLNVRLLRPGSTSVRLTTYAADAQTSVFSQTISLPGPTLTKKTLTSTPQVALCGPTPQAVIGGQEGGGCAERLIFGVIEAEGCLTRIAKVADVRDEDGQFLEGLVAEFNDNAQLREYVFEFCLELDLGQCQRYQHQIDLRDVGDVLKLTDFYQSAGTVRINGIKFSGTGGHAIFLGPHMGRVVSKSALLSFGSVPLSHGLLNLDVGGDGPLYNSVLASSSLDLGKALSIGPVPVGKISELDSLGGFLPIGDVKLALKRSATSHFTEADFTLRLPKEFQFMGGQIPSGRTSIKADNEHGIYLDTLLLKLDEAHLGPALLTNLSFTYRHHGSPDIPQTCQEEYWKGTANIYFGPSTDNGGVRMSPPPDANGIAFCDGSFDSAGFVLDFKPPLPKPQIYPGVFLNSIGASIKLDPLVMTGTLGLNVVQMLDATGHTVIAFPTPTEPYPLSASDAAWIGANSLAGRTFKSTTVVTGGDIAIDIDGTMVPLGTGFTAYQYPDYIALGGKIELDTIPQVHLNGRFDGEISLTSSPTYNLHGHVEASVEGIPASFGADTWLTNKGMVLCGDASGVHPGAGYHWGDDLPEIWFPDGCAPSSYWVPEMKPPNASNRALAGSGMRVQSSGHDGIKLVGQGHAPEVRLVAPDGSSVDTASDDFVVSKSLSILRQESTNTTYVGILDGKPGTYKIRLLADSAPVTKTFHTGSAKAAKIHGVVHGSGARRVLSYSMQPIPGRTVTFFSAGKDSYQRIGRARPGHHHLAFTVVGSAGARRIVAETSLHGVVRLPQKVASFRVHIPDQLKAPTKLTVSRRSSTVRAHWAPVPWADAYDVVLIAESGLRRSVHVTGTTARFSHIARWEHGKLRVVAERAGGAGKVTTAKLTSRYHAPTRFLPYGELTRG